MENIPIIVDGPNFVNRVLDMGIKSIFVESQLSLACIKKSIAGKIAEQGIVGRFDSIEFICSNRRFGPKKNRFSECGQESMPNRFRKETGVYVDVISLPGTSEMGVDSTVSEKLREYSNDSHTIVLVAADRDSKKTFSTLCDVLPVCSMHFSSCQRIQLPLRRDDSKVFI